MPISPADAAHLLRRAGFGATRAEIDHLSGSPDRPAAVDQVLDLSSDPTDPVPTVLDADGVFPGWWRMTTWWLERMRTTPVGIVEKMTLFWHDHFVSGYPKCPSIALLARQHGVFRHNALGDLHALTQDVAIDPAMLVYLDNWLNVSQGPQENFARELLELFTLGVGNFAEGDIGELARAWTGYSLAKGYREHQFYGQFHDGGSKSIFGLPARNWTGPETITEILHGTKAVPASEFMVAKIFSHLAYPVTADEAPVPALATGFRQSGLDVLSLVRDILLSDEFWSDRARHALARSPLEWMVASAKALDLTVADIISPFDVAAVGQVPFGHPEVDGWGANDHWISTGGSWSRSSWAARVRFHSFYGGVFSGVGSGTPAEIANEGFDRFGIVDPSPTTRSAVENWAATSLADGDAAIIPFNLPMLMMLTPEFQVS